MEVGSGSSSDSSSSTSSGSLNELKFDKKNYFGEPSPAAESKRPPLAPGKKGGVMGQGGQPPVRCQVEGCQFDLHSVKGYYYRHRVCGIHSKSAKVIVNGVEQRFCQQCSRFHLVSEFDKGKRSCRRRLACHNQRRRKPPSDGTLFSCNGSSKSESSSKAGSVMLDFSVQPLVLTGSWDSHPNPYATRPERALGENTQTDAHPWHRNLAEIAARSNNFGLRECLTGVSDCSRALSLSSVNSKLGLKTPVLLITRRRNRCHCYNTTHGGSSSSTIRLLP